MSETTNLEHRYRRLLAFYPRAFRREREQEMLSVLMEGSAPGQQRPGAGESADLVTRGIGMRVRQTEIPSRFERKHAGLWISVRVAVGLWLLFITAVLCSGGQYWSLALLPAAALHFFLAYRLAQPAIERERGREQRRSPTGTH